MQHTKFDFFCLIDGCWVLQDRDDRVNWRCLTLIRHSHKREPLQIIKRGGAGWTNYWPGELTELYVKRPDVRQVRASSVLEHHLSPAPGGGSLQSPRLEFIPIYISVCILGVD